MEILTQSETSRLAELESVIHEGFAYFAKVGLALIEIRDSKLYRAAYNTFDEYCRSRWGIDSKRAYVLIAGAGVVKNLAVEGFEKMPSIDDKKPLPKHETQTRPLRHLSPKQQRQAWEKATEKSAEPKEKEVRQAVVKTVLDDPVPVDDKGTARQIKFVQANGISEVVQACKDGEITFATAERIASLPQEEQFLTLTKPTKPKEIPVSGKTHWVDKGRGADGVPVKTGAKTQLQDRVPDHFMRQIITPDMAGRGYAVYSDVAGKPCSLSPFRSELEYRECAAHAIAGSARDDHRKAHAKWDKYEAEKIREQILKILAKMSPLEVEADIKAPAFRYEYGLDTAADMRELAQMVSADLLRYADTLEQREKWGHIKY